MSHLLLTRSALRVARLIRYQPAEPERCRTMATSRPISFDYLIVVPDKPNSIAKRLEVRQTHLQNLVPRVEKREVRMGGGLLSDVPENENDPTTYGFIGSAMVFKATSKEHALELAKSDIYATSGVWDMDKIQVYPFKPAVWTN